MSFSGPQNMFSSGVNSIGNAFGNTANVISNATSLSGSVVAVMMVVLISMVVIGYVVYRFLVSSLKSTDLTSGIVHTRSGAKTVTGKQLPELINGREWSSSFWVYLDTSSHTTNFKNLLTFGTDKETAPFMAVMDTNTNMMFLVFRLDSASSTVDNMSELTSFKSGIHDSNNVVIVPIEYVPLSRWMMITVVVDQDTITTYKDNHIYSVVSSTRFNPNAVIADPVKTEVTLGSSNNGADAYLSKVKFFNFGLSVYQVESQYKTGPGNSGLLGVLGVSKYRLQWPVTTATS
ncbi:putative concanavalin A-like lectin/glucanase domain-containing protein [Tetraselmis virus 1]|uniref:Putative concanavalin A-like lectin/glucanase domain-containing protein n=1 Tax=Tetraselmis virus 1 TaxID=2060617 RepID=A0A2P0VMP5_9VIRU|nr:putative concanavalin A-like lectin/glucanase domain-containing protein [Tetraselmis virus 1]AUF82178.1 putative concanavalin A-like lectin/glucanase domain-containing protein [Tetraselmis virus 1]